MSTQGEHTFDQDILIAGEEIRGYTAGEDLEQGEPLAITGDYEVSGADEGGPFVGVALYDVANGEEVAIGGDDCEVRIEFSEALSAGDAITPDDLGTFRQATADDDAVGVVNLGAGVGEIGEAYLTDTTGELGEA